MDQAARLSLALALVPGVGPARHRELRERHGSAAAAAEAVLGDRRAALLADADAVAADAARVGAALWTVGRAPYPAACGELTDPPTHLFALGDAAVLDRPRVAIVGTRDATAYGARMAGELARAFAAAGACVVSGLALGVDARSHEAALEAGGATCAVLGTGVDVPYPARHAALHGRVARDGLVLSEHGPGARAHPGCFPRRNRVIAALAELVVVVEAGARSGALITVDHALDLGRTVAAVPGPIDSPQSAGSNALLRDGAAVIASLDDALALLSLGRPAPRAAEPPAAADERLLWDALRAPCADVEALAARTRLPARECLLALTALEMSGRVELALTGEIRRR